MRTRLWSLLLLSTSVAIPATRQLSAPTPVRALGISAGGEEQSVRIRTSPDAQHWSAWREYHSDPAEGTLIWFDSPVRYVEVDTQSDARFLLIDPGVTPSRTKKGAAGEIQGRADWCPAPFVCPKTSSPTPTTPTHLIVHHTAGTNSATDWAAVMRAIWELHVKGNGWADIGYNFLIDPNGVAYEGRGDGVLGAHFSAVNTGTSGVSLIGTYTDRPPTSAALATLLDLLTAQAQRHGLDPNAQTLHAASRLELNVISGHRDAGLSPQASGRTECPGLALYPILPALREEVCRRLPGCLPARQRPNSCAEATGPCLAQYGVVNSATADNRPVAAGSIASAYGRNLAGLRAVINGRATTITGESDSQLNLLVPLATEPGTSRLQLFAGTELKAERLMWVTEAAPAVYLALNHDQQTINSASAPVSSGRPLTVYLAGARSNLPWSATIGSFNAPTLYVGPAPGFNGVWQANVIVPAELATGEHPLIITISGVPSSPIIIGVQK